MNFEEFIDSTSVDVGLDLEAHARAPGASMLPPFAFFRPVHSPPHAAPDVRDSLLHRRNPLDKPADSEYKKAR